MGAGITSEEQIITSIPIFTFHGESLKNDGIWRKNVKNIFVRVKNELFKCEKI